MTILALIGTMAALFGAYLLGHRDGVLREREKQAFKALDRLIDAKCGKAKPSATKVEGLGGDGGAKHGGAK